LIGLDALERRIGSAPGMVTFGSCDNGVLYDSTAFDSLAQDPNIDVIVWGARGHINAIRRPGMFGWIDAAPDGKIRRISVKSPLRSPNSDPIVIGIFTFRRASDFRASVERLFGRQGRVNNEFYIDEAINDSIELGLICVLFEVDSFLSWGTPDDLRTFEYWQSCFHKWAGHSYSLNRDGRIPPSALPELEARYQPKAPRLPLPRE
jgi:hypothetical protein